MPPKRKAPAKKKKEESPPPSESEPESESEQEVYSEEEPESPKSKRTKAAAKPKVTSKPKAAPISPAAKKGKPASKGKKETVKTGAKGEVTAEKKGARAAVQKTASATPEKRNASHAVAKQVIIEHCKQCQSFKRTATKLEELLKKAIPDLEVSLNPDKPRKGIFEVRDNEGNVFLSLQGLVRPFKKMKDLNLEETADDVASKLTE